MGKRSKKEKKRTTDWSVAETDFLIDLWEADYQALEETRKHGPFFRKISDSLVQKGYYRTALQVQKKIQQLKTKYRHNKHAPDWPHIERLRRLLQNLPEPVRKADKVNNCPNMSISQPGPVYNSAPIQQY